MMSLKEVSSSKRIRYWVLLNLVVILSFVVKTFECHRG